MLPDTPVIVSFRVELFSRKSHKTTRFKRTQGCSASFDPCGGGDGDDDVTTLAKFPQQFFLILAGGHLWRAPETAVGLLAADTGPLFAFNHGLRRLASRGTLSIYSGISETAASVIEGSRQLLFKILLVIYVSRLLCRLC